MEITIADLSLALYGEISNEISRGNDALLEQKIATGKGEVYGYLHRYDTDTMFNPVWEDAHFKSLCVAVIVWHLIVLANPNIHMDILRQQYEDAISYLEKVQKGTVRPNWPLRPDDPESIIDDAGNVQFTTNPKRNNHY